MNKYELSEAYIGGPTGEIMPGGKVRLGKGGGGGGTSTTTQEIPVELKPLATKYTQQAMDISARPYTPFTGQRYASLNPTQNLGIGMVQDRALTGSPTMRGAEAGLNQFIAGGNTNPYLDSLVGKAQQSVVDRFNNMVKPQIESSMVRSGSFGNEGLNQLMQNQQKAAAEQMGDIATQMYGNAYNTDQANRMQAIGMAPTFGNAAYYDASQLLNAGQLQQDQAQRNLDFGYQQFMEGQNKPYKDAAMMAGVFGSNLGGSSTTQQSSGGGK